ncbi:hypothetical protein L228DRAFT_270535 [Xylona heveae TC161]|uniref:BTB domain-containing protein n=1 Tax=Xylona heveae (strain CBS 132557 / TC161) TaxID=1328760 RepID=A0A165AH71_XYLHT|nr:hypothetical protein L228DRAFT_270535 [Xylona heveae TC161]KZF20466.1 hypothetical protein L228DRAFT_270535 [Xylona heveae TC161]
MSGRKRCGDRDTVLRTVEIWLTPEKRLFIHSSILISCSEFFAASLDKAWTSHRGMLSKNENAPIIYKLNLEEDPCGDSLTIQDLQSKTAIPSSDWESEHIRDETYYRAFENMIGIFQHVKPILEGVEDTLQLVKLADKYDCLPVISRAVRLALLESDGNASQLYRDISKQPVDYLYIGEMTRSSIILREAAIHVLGTWSGTKQKCRDTVSQKLFDTLCEKYEHLRQKKEHANEMLLSLNYSQSISLDFASVSESMVALLMVRENISKIYSNCFQNKKPEHFEGKLYRALEKSAKIELPSSKKITKHYNAPSFEDVRKELETKIRQALGDLPRSYLRADQTEINADYLLCAKLDDADLPWKEDW